MRLILFLVVQITLQDNSPVVPVTERACIFAAVPAALMRSQSSSASKGCLKDILWFSGGSAPLTLKYGYEYVFISNMRNLDCLQDRQLQYLQCSYSIHTSSLLSSLVIFIWICEWKVSLSDNLNATQVVQHTSYIFFSNGEAYFID